MESASAGNDKTEDVTSCWSHYFKCPQNFSLEVESVEEHITPKLKDKSLQALEFCIYRRTVIMLKQPRAVTMKTVPASLTSIFQRKTSCD